MVELNFKPGDLVRLRLSDKEIDVTILESPEKEIVLVKLDSGYNTGIKRENILAARKIPVKKEENITEEVKYEDKKDLPKIGMIITGGTIASKLDSKTGGVKPLSDVSDLRRDYPELFEKVNVKSFEMPFLIASESMDSSHWIQIAESAKKMLDDSEIEGVIVTHGTDTLGYTAAALSFFLQNLNKPVVLTYSQRSSDRASSDARLNLLCAAEMALSNCAEVVLVGHATTNDDYCYALRGTKVRKMHSSMRDAFKPINTEPIAKVWSDKVEFVSEYKLKDSRNKPELDTSFTDKVGLVQYYPGQDSSILDYYALSYKGIVVEGTGFGHLPVSEAKNNWIPKLKKYIRNGLVVCVTTQTINGSSNQYVYSNLRELAEAGVIFLEDMLPETAFVKIGYVLGHQGWKTKAKEKMLSNISGEIGKTRHISL